MHCGCIGSIFGTKTARRKVSQHSRPDAANAIVYEGHMHTG